MADPSTALIHRTVVVWLSEEYRNDPFLRVPGAFGEDVRVTRRGAVAGACIEAGVSRAPHRA